MTPVEDRDRLDDAVVDLVVVHVDRERQVGEVDDEDASAKRRGVGSSGCRVVGDVGDRGGAELDRGELEGLVGVGDVEDQQTAEGVGEEDEVARLDGTGGFVLDRYAGRGGDAGNDGAALGSAGAAAPAALGEARGVVDRGLEEGEAVVGILGRWWCYF